MTKTIKYDTDGYFNTKKVLFTFFYINISQFIRNFDGMFDDVCYKKTTNIMHIDGCKNIYFKSFGVSMMGHDCAIIKMKDCLRSPRSSRRLHKYVKIK